LSQVAQKFVVILVVAGFIIGSGLGYYLAPQKVEVETKTVTVTKSPLADTTQRLGFICSDTSRTEYEFVIMEDMITPDINEYLKTLGFDMEVEILIDDAQGQIATHLEKVQAFKSIDVNIWMGTEDIGRRVRVIDDAGEAAIPLRCFGTLMSPAASWKWDRHVERYDQHTGMIAGFYTAILEDCAWTMLKSVLETDSMDATDIIEVFPDVSSSYYGTTGWCDIDEYGDRKPSIYEIWGYALVDGEPSFMKFGEADAPTHTVAWDLDALQSQGLTPPGH